MRIRDDRLSYRTFVLLRRLNPSPELVQPRVVHFDSVGAPMAMTMEQHRQLGAVGFDHFSDPWASTSSANSLSQLYPTSLGSSTHLGFDALAKQQTARANSTSMPYNSVTASAPSVSAGSGYSSGTYSQPGVMGIGPDLVNPPRASYNPGYSAAPNPSLNAFSSASNMYLSPFGNMSQQPQNDMDRRLSQQ